MPKLQKKPPKRHYCYQYAVKFICTATVPGTSQTTPSFPTGQYRTAVNIHNPNYKKVWLREKLAMPGLISNYFGDRLGPDEVDRIDCTHIGAFGIQTHHGFEGFLVIESTRRIDVVAVYTAADDNDVVRSIEVERVPGRRICDLEG